MGTSLSIHKGEQHRKILDRKKGKKTLCLPSDRMAFCACAEWDFASVLRELPALRAGTEQRSGEAADRVSTDISPAGTHCSIASLWPDSRGQDAGGGGLTPPAPPPSILTINDPLDPPDAQRDDEANGVPGAAGAVGHCGGHHRGQREDDDGSVKHLSGQRDTRVTPEL